jgi:hypothetical protein
VEIGCWTSFAHFDFGYLSEIITLTGFGLQTFARFGDPCFKFYGHKFVRLFMPNVMSFCQAKKRSVDGVVGFLQDCSVPRLDRNEVLLLLKNPQPECTRLETQDVSAEARPFGPEAADLAWKRPWVCFHGPIQRCWLCRQI